MSKLGAACLGQPVISPKGRAHQRVGQSPGRLQAPSRRVFPGARIRCSPRPAHVIMLFRKRLRHIHYVASHLAERFGLFVLIALCESVVAIGLSAQHSETLDLSGGLAVVAAFGLSYGLWWVYFAFASDAVRHALETAKMQLDITRLVLSYGHLAFIASYS